MQRTIPVLCVVTGCENEENMQNWSDKNSVHFINTNMLFQSMVGVCCAKGGRFESTFVALREESKGIVWQNIVKYAKDTPEIFIQSSEGIMHKIKAVWNVFCTAFKMPGMRVLHWELHTGLVEMGAKDAEAAAVSTQFVNAIKKN